MPQHVIRDQAEDDVQAGAQDKPQNRAWDLQFMSGHVRESQLISFCLSCLQVLSFT